LKIIKFRKLFLIKDREIEHFCVLPDAKFDDPGGHSEANPPKFSKEFFGFVEIPVLVPQCAFVTSSMKQS
jgi:hypothetical protein